MGNNKIAVGLDIGTTKIVAMIGRKNEYDKIEVVGTGKAKSLGVKRGVVSNITQTIQSIQQAVEEAESVSGITIDNVVVGIAGQHIRSLQHSDYITRSNADEVIDDTDIENLVNQVHKLVMLPGEEIIHVLPQEFKVDSQADIKEPAEDMGLVKSSKEAVIFSIGHDSLIRTAFNMFKDQPLFGHGPKMFRIICKDEKYATGVSPCMTHPHNFYVQLLAETGIVGFLFLFSTLIFVLYSALRQFKSIILKQKRPLTDYQVCLLAGILITVWPLTPNGNFFHNWLMIAYCLPVGFYLQSIFSKKAIK